MKKTIRSLLVSLPLLIAAAPSFAGFQLRMPLEVAGGGTMPNGSITFGNKAETPPEPVEPTEPEVVDPFAPENPACDPLAQDYPGNVTGKELEFGFDIWGEIVDGVNGPTYRTCKLKDTNNPELLARFLGGISFPRKNLDGITYMLSDYCNPKYSGNYTDATKCMIYAGPLTYNFTPQNLGNGQYTFAALPVAFSLFGVDRFGYEEIGRIVVDGVDCSNIRKDTRKVMGKPVEIEGYRVCDYGVGYEELRLKTGKPYIVEIYRK